MTSEQQNPLAVDKISSLILRFSVPSIIAMLVSAVYNIADQLFIGNACYTTEAHEDRYIVGYHRKNSPHKDHLWLLGNAG